MLFGVLNPKLMFLTEKKNFTNQQKIHFLLQNINEKYKDIFDQVFKCAGGEYVSGTDRIKVWKNTQARKGKQIL